jgi:hypothetical protein
MGLTYLKDENDYTSDTSDALDFNINRATKWHNLNNRGCKPTVIYKLDVTALKGLNIRLVSWIHYSTPPGLPGGFLVFTVGCTHGYSN